MWLLIRKPISYGLYIQNKRLVEEMRLELIHYIQGQTCAHTNRRQYFYYISHEGMLFLDDARMKNFTSCFKEQKFLKFFFDRIKLNSTEKYTIEFPYVSQCGTEMNYIRCDDLPLVFTHIIDDSSQSNNGLLSYGHAGHLLTVPFEPQKLFMCAKTGRVYHPAMDRVGGIGLVKSSLAMELSKRFQFNDQQSPHIPTHFEWNHILYELSNELNEKVVKN